MTLRARLGAIAVGFAALALAYWGFLLLFPNEADCVATGRIVDPTRRHCESANGYVQLREHVILHSWEVLIYVVVLGVVAFLVRRISRAKRAPIRP